MTGPFTILGFSPASPEIADFLKKLSPDNIGSLNQGEVKSYPDAVYFNYYKLGLSLQFVPQNGYRPPTNATIVDLDLTRLTLDSIDIFNRSDTPEESQKSRPKSSSPKYDSFSALPIALPTPTNFEISSQTTGKQFVEGLGEPSRKGGGSGPLSGSINIWCEWTEHGIMVEFGGNDARGPQAWERGKDAVWAILTIFKPRSNK
ncbi:hypothetical protein SISSUDRAFT_982046 [Sistotremastrum suecicum HHB10207 ss-3]|nr:hypothetical protein SISSUDRAFT_982046 [Sistotremastrum suecicum HHB10207 ss-3]